MEHNSSNLEKTSVQWLKLLAGLIVVFAMFHWTADALGSDRGQFGVIVGLLIVASLIFAERFLFGKSFKESVEALGLTQPNKIGLLIVIAICVLMFLTIFIFAAATNSTFSFYPEWYWLIPGLFFQAGLAEETLFRGYLFGHIRQKYTFWKAATLAAFPFILVHLILFYTMPLPIAAASIILSIITSFPFARLYELGGKTIWSPAILHFVVQGTVKILVASGESAEIFPIFWIAVCALIPLLVFFVPNHEKDNLSVN